MLSTWNATNKGVIHSKNPTDHILYIWSFIKMTLLGDNPDPENWKTSVKHCKACFSLVNCTLHL